MKGRGGMESEKGEREVRGKKKKGGGEQTVVEEREDWEEEGEGRG